MDPVTVGLILSTIGTGAGVASQQKGAKLAKKSNKEQKALLEEQEKREKLKLAEAESEIGRRKALRQGGGRSMLLAPQTQMGSTTIGG